MKRPLLTACHLCEGTGIIIEKRGEGAVRARPCACEEVRVLPAGITDKQIDKRLNDAARVIHELEHAFKVAADLVGTGQISSEGDFPLVIDAALRECEKFRGRDVIRLSLQSDKEKEPRTWAHLKVGDKLKDGDEVLVGDKWERIEGCIGWEIGKDGLFGKYRRPGGVA